MASNDKYLLDQLILESHHSIAPEMSEEDYFEIYAAELLLRKFALSYDEIESGIVGNAADGGIDALYAFVDDELVTPDSEFENAKSIELIAVQVKRSTTFTERSITTLISTFHDLLDLTKQPDRYVSIYNSDVIGFFRTFHDVYLSLITKFPTLKFTFYYATKGDRNTVHPNVIHRTQNLRERIKERFSEFEFSFNFVGAGELFELARKQSAPNLQLRVAESLSPSDGGYVCLVSLKDYYSFIKDETGGRRQAIFDANVREYEGSVEVNKGIRKTLEEGLRDVNFWWLNNGCTIVATKAVLSGKDLILEDAKVVNGLQTSQEIYRYFSANPDANDERLILVRVIKTDSEEIRNEIIKATNSQSRISPYSLRATEPIHHSIEQDFRHKGLFYDRQKNFYKNQRKPKGQIITIQYLAQAVAATILQKPNDSRGRPTNLIKSAEEYKKIFNEDYPVSIYLKSALLMRTVDTFLRTNAPDHVKRDRTSLRYQLAMFIPCILAKSSLMTVKIFETVNLDEIDNAMLTSCANHVWQVFEELKVKKRLDGDLIAKSSDFDDDVLKRVTAILRGEMSLEIVISANDKS